MREKVKTLEAQVNKIDELDDIKLKEAAEYINNGGIIVYPTETVYGLGADALNEEAVRKIFKAKGRSYKKPLTVIVASKDINDYVREIPDSAERFINKFWPGPLTIVLKKNDIIPDVTSAGLDSIGLRMTSNKLALKLAKLSNTIITATSANISGNASHTEVEECARELKSKVDYIITDNEINGGIESTLVDCTVNPPKVLRRGAVTLEMLREVVPDTEG